MRRRLDELQGRIDQVDGASADAKTQSDRRSGSSSQGAGRALRVSSEFIGGVVVGSFIGYWIDRAFGSWPIGFVVFFLLGIAAGFVNVMRAARQIQAEMPDIAPGATPPGDDDDDEDNAGAR